MLGKLSASKGSETLGKALAMLFAEFDDRGPNVVVQFRGKDQGCSLHGGRPMRECILEHVPEEYAEQVVFKPPVPHKDLPALLRYLKQRKGLVAAIVPSELDTFNLVPHELARARIPLVISDIPAFQEHWHDGNAFVHMFRHGDPASLMAALVSVLGDASKRLRVQLGPRITYADPGAIYQELGS